MARKRASKRVRVWSHGYCVDAAWILVCEWENGNRERARVREWERERESWECARAESRVKRRETKGIGVGKIAEGYERDRRGEKKWNEEERRCGRRRYERERERERGGKKAEDRSMDVKEGWEKNVCVYVCMCMRERARASVREGKRRREIR